MVNDDRKQARRSRVYAITLHVIRKGLTPRKNRLTAILTQKKPKSVPGLEPGLQNAVALSLAPPPLP